MRILISLLQHPDILVICIRGISVCSGFIIMNNNPVIRAAKYPCLSVILICAWRRKIWRIPFGVDNSLGSHGTNVELYDISERIDLTKFPFIRRGEISQIDSLIICIITVLLTLKLPSIHIEGHGDKASLIRAGSIKQTVFFI